MYQTLQKQRDKFSAKEFADQVQYTQQDIERAKRKIYQTLLERAWRDGKVAADEFKTLQWSIEKLDIPQTEATAIQHQIARDRFAVALSKAMDDGFLDDQEAKYLDDIARSVGCTLGDFVGTYFRLEGENFLRGIFAACTEGGALADDVWARLLKTTERLGLSRKALATAILPQAERFIEHVLADAKSDGELSEDEETQLLKLIRTLGLPQSSQSYIQRTISALRTIRMAGQGKLPVVDAPKGIAIRAGEIVHLNELATWYQRRILKSGDRWDEHIGTLTITDNRVLFSSDTRSFNVRFGRIARYSGETGIIRLQRMEKPESVIRLGEEEPIAYAILEGAIAFSNQTRLSQQGGLPTRRIPREVRQRVWQRYGGRCAECGDGQYLEFDHVIPVAKGGSNSDANVQLLCRRCNLKKSDFI
jgi:tellurite resistance protein